MKLWIWIYNRKCSLENWEEQIEGDNNWYSQKEEVKIKNKWMCGGSLERENKT